MSSRPTAVALVLLGLLPGCTCDDKTRTKAPELELPLPDGGDATGVSFGLVQVNVEHLRKVNLRNGGTAALTVTALETQAPFGMKNSLPMGVGVGEEVALLVTYTPVIADQHQTGHLVISSDDRLRPSLTLALDGQGIQAALAATPDPLDFGDVYLNETRTLTFTVSNAGTDDLDILSAEWVPSQPTVSGSLLPLVAKIPANGSVSVDLTFAPLAMGALSGWLELTPDPLQAEKRVVQLHGRGVIALPRLCFQPDGEPEACTDAAAAAPNLEVRFSACDSRLYPPDSGASACTAATHLKSGQLYFRNEGNVQVQYTAQYSPYTYGTKDRCDAGYPAESDFAFSNAPGPDDGGAPGPWTDGPVQLPLVPGVAQPWKSDPVTLAYGARSRCRDEATDVARVIWTRQGEAASHLPRNIFLTVIGGSRLPAPVTSDWTCGAIGQPAAVPCRNPFYGVANSGDAPLDVTAVELWEELPLVPDSGIADAGGPNGGYFVPCTSNPYGSCAQFGWDDSDGGDPNQYAPHAVPPAAGSQSGQQVLGTLVFGPNGAIKNSACPDGGTLCAQPNNVYRVYAVVRTSDPYTPTLVTRLEGVAAPGQ